LFAFELLGELFVAIALLQGVQEDKLLGYSVRPLCGRKKTSKLQRRVNNLLTRRFLSFIRPG
jgi:hypothetical protein